jgi:hypothetical protein
MHWPDEREDYDLAQNSSIWSIGSAGSILSIGSAGSILSIGSIGSILAIRGWRQLPSRHGTRIRGIRQAIDRVAAQWRNG